MNTSLQDIDLYENIIQKNSILELLIYDDSDQLNHFTIDLKDNIKYEPQIIHNKYMAPYYNNRSNTKLHTNYDFIQKLNDIKRLKKNMTHDEKKDINEKFVSNEKYFLNVLKKYTDNEEKVYKDNVFNSTTLTDHISAL